ncbi:hypothetical protein BC939DRAFT_469112 [Gamsiella multidivaricata]|uniref:uncharacterized protein n=1 Tax=Gamsiella multidivaricata TaxID=101098 RepID=UPI0022206EA4|nr:uncharacterized protein BC939DRAFT_469112 [Gamsiella multidivaricata]KAI7816459.1 hypothetical protein BC939DRAFT_469112 [Gamsiella multidivaricata]
MHFSNCCFCLPLRGGGMWLSGLCLLLSVIGAAFLFLWGSFFFFSSILVIFLGGFSVLQGGAALIAFFAFWDYSYMLARMFVYTQWLFTFVSAARIGLVAFTLERNRGRIADECLNGLDSNERPAQGTPNSFFCNTPIDSFVLAFIVGLAVDWVLNGYMYFVVWRFYVRMRLYPDTIKGEEFTYEEALDEL